MFLNIVLLIYSYLHKNGKVSFYELVLYQIWSLYVFAITVVRLRTYNENIILRIVQNAKFSNICAYNLIFIYVSRSEYA